MAEGKYCREERAATILRLSEDQTVIEASERQRVIPETRLSELPLLTESEHQKLLVERNDTTVVPPETGFIHQLFEKQVECTP